MIAAKAVAFKEALSREFKDYQQRVINNAKRLAEELIKRGFRIISGGTDNHLMLVDLTTKGITGKEAEEALDKAGITVNKNAIPYDERPPAVTSGMRLGTPSVTTRGMGEAEMANIADIIDEVLKNHASEEKLRGFKQMAENICKRFPIY